MRFSGLLDDVKSPIIVVYTMGKVGSKTISQSLADADIPCFDVHVLNRTRLQRQIEDILRKGGDLPPNIGESIVLNYRALRRRVLYISIVRDPVARNLSAVFQNMPESQNATLESMLEAINRYPARMPDYWFQQELLHRTGFTYEDIAIPDGVFHRTLHRQNISLLMVKLGISDRDLGELVSNYIGANVKVTRRNQAAEKWYSREYEQILSQKMLGRRFLAESLANECLKWFWSSKERDAIRAKYGFQGATDSGI